MNNEEGRVFIQNRSRCLLSWINKKIWSCSAPQFKVIKLRVKAVIHTYGMGDPTLRSSNSKMSGKFQCNPWLNKREVTRSGSGSAHLWSTVETHNKILHMDYFVCFKDSEKLRRMPRGGFRNQTKGQRIKNKKASLITLFLKGENTCYHGF